MVYGGGGGVNRAKGCACRNVDVFAGVRWAVGRRRRDEVVGVGRQTARARAQRGGPMGGRWPISRAGRRRTPVPSGKRPDARSTDRRCRPRIPVARGYYTTFFIPRYNNI